MASSSLAYKLDLGGRDGGPLELINFSVRSAGSNNAFARVNTSFTGSGNDLPDGMSRDYVDGMDTNERLAVAENEIKHIVKGIDQIGSRIEALSSQFDARLTRFETAVDSRLARSEEKTETRFTQLEVSIRQENKATRTTVLTTVIGTGLAIVALVVSIQSGLVSAFQTGLTAVQNTSTERESQQAAPPRLPEAATPAPSSASPSPSSSSDTSAPVQK